MANSAFHKKQAEGLIVQANRLRDIKPVYWRDDHETLIELAQVHATLATVQDAEEE